MLPQAVFDLWQFDLRNSVDQAEKGNVKGGRKLLEAGLKRARQDAADGRQWAHVLIKQYEHALANFDRRYPHLQDEP